MFTAARGRARARARAGAENTGDTPAVIKEKTLTEDSALQHQRGLEF